MLEFLLQINFFYFFFILPSYQAGIFFKFLAMLLHICNRKGIWGAISIMHPGLVRKDQGLHRGVCLAPLLSGTGINMEWRDTELSSGSLFLIHACRCV